MTYRPRHKPCGGRENVDQLTVSDGQTNIQGDLKCDKPTAASRSAIHILPQIYPQHVVSQFERNRQSDRSRADTMRQA